MPSVPSLMDAGFNGSTPALQGTRAIERSLWTSQPRKAFWRSERRQKAKMIESRQSCRDSMADKRAPSDFKSRRGRRVLTWNSGCPRSGSGCWPHRSRCRRAGCRAGCSEPPRCWSTPRMSRPRLPGRSLLRRLTGKVRVRVQAGEPISRIDASREDGSDCEF
jgi:hypothetical protein